MDNFGKRTPGGVTGSTANKSQSIPANRPSAIKVPPVDQQLHRKPHFHIRRRRGMSPEALSQAPSTPQQPETVVPTEALSALDMSVREIRHRKRRKGFKGWAKGLIITLVVLLFGGIIWGGVQLLPVNHKDKSLVEVEIPLGSSPAEIADTLKERKVIRSSMIFLTVTRLQGIQGQLQAGTYRLSPSESVFAIAAHLKKGVTDVFDITFLPGATISQNKKTLMNAGYDKKEVDEAFDAKYDSPLFEGKPASADLEGYIFGDTYRFTMGTSAKKVLEKVFANFYAVVSERRLDRGFAKRNMTMYQAITLASIIQRESGGGDEAQISQVFQKRLAMKMPLGSDVTYQYIADKTGVPRDPNLDSPYNTRIKVGLPPGPISSPGVQALRAVSLPAEGDYIYFLSGDDDVTYFAKTLEEHEANIKNHCQKKCQII